MEFISNLNNVFMYQHNLTFSQNIICSYFIRDHSWIKARITDREGDYLRIAPKKMIEIFPFVSEKENTFRHIFKKLVEKDIFQVYKDETTGQTPYYRFNPKYIYEYRNPKEFDDSVNEITGSDSNCVGVNEITEGVNEITEGVNEITQSLKQQSLKQNHKNNNHSNKASNSFLLEILNKFLEKYPSGTKYTQPHHFATARQNVNIHAQDLKINIVFIEKSLENYKKTTDYQKNIMAPNSFLTRWREYQDINKLRDAGKLQEDFEEKKSASGAAKTVCPITGKALEKYDFTVRDNFNNAQKEQFSRIMLAAQQVREIAASGAADADSRIRELFNDAEYAAFESNGGIHGPDRMNLDTFAQAMMEDIYNIQGVA